MMFIIKQKEINDILKNICAVVEQKNINDNDKIIDCVYFDVKPDGITLIASSSDIQAKAYIKGSFSSDSFSFCVNAKNLSESISTLQSLLDINFSIENNNVLLSSGKTKYTFTNLLTKEQEYPILKLNNLVSLFKIKNDSLKKSLQSVSFAMGANHLRYFLAGILLRVTKSKAVFVSTDTHRMAYYTISDDTIGDLDKSIIIPKKTVNYLEKHLGAICNEVELSLASDDYIIFKNDNYEIISKLIIGAYPEFEKVFSQTLSKEIVVDSQNFHDAINRIAIFATDKFKTINLGFEKDNLIIESKSSVNETAKTEIEMKYSGDPIKINFNVQYIAEVLSKIEENETKILFNDQNSMVVFVFVGNDNYKYVLMPLRV